MTPHRWIAALLGLTLLTAACAGDPSGEPSPGPTVGSDELAVTVASYDLAVGDQQRFIAGVLTPQRELIGFGQVQMRFAHLGADPSGPATPGPVATAAWLPVPGIEPNGASDHPTMIDQPGVAGVYQTRVDLDRPGFWTVEVSAQVDGGQRTGTATFSVADRHQVPAVGDPAPASRNLTVDSDVDPAAIDSRAATGGAVPDPSLHATTIADAIAAGRPVVVVFSTPVYCVSRFCGPITDTIETLASTYADRAAFIHVEVWRDFETSQLNDAAAEWIVTDSGGNEPWVLLIGADGTIAARWDNVLDRAELEQLLEALPQ